MNMRQLENKYTPHKNWCNFILSIAEVLQLNLDSQVIKYISEILVSPVYSKIESLKKLVLYIEK